MTSDEHFCGSYDQCVLHSIDWFCHTVLPSQSLTDTCIMTLTAFANYMLALIDIDYARWLMWLFTPIVIAFLLPLVLLLFMYGSALFLHVYKLRHWIKEAYYRDIWDGARASVASFWDAQGWIWHGYGVEGFEHIPDKGPALIIYYHGTLPIDVYYLMAKIIIFKRRRLRCVADRLVFRVPGWKMLMEVFQVTPGTVDTCVEMLQAGNLLCISPGGMREALFADPAVYDTMWGARSGFVKIALSSGVPVIPMFTRNCREAFRTPVWGKDFYRRVYERTRIPLMPLYGGFPVKLISYLGEPITFDKDTSVEEARAVIKEGILLLISCHQQLPGSILRAVLQRIPYLTHRTLLSPTLSSSSNTLSTPLLSPDLDNSD